MVSIECRNLTKVFRSFRKSVVAVDHVSFETKESEFVSLLGPSGCGKTTTLRMIVGLETPTEGDIYFDDERMNDIPVQKRDIAMVFQRITLFPFMTIRQNMAYALKIKKVGKSEQDRKVKEAANLLHLERHLDSKPEELSGGEQQRVALGRAFISDPKILLLDEPLSDLDARLKDELRGEVRKVHDRLGTTTIYVTHDQLEAMTMSDRIMVMKDGIFMQDGTPEEIFHYPRNVFTAGFIGSPSINFFEGSLVEAAGNPRIDLGYFSLSLAENVASKIRQEASSDEVVLGIRPQAIILSKDMRDAHLSGTVRLVEPLGARTIVQVEKEGNIIRVDTPEVRGRKDVAVSEKVGLHFDRNSFYVFDKRTGNVLSFTLESG